MTETEEKWVARVREWRASGKTAADFAAGRGFEGSTLRYWASQLRGRIPAPPAAATRTRTSTAEPIAPSAAPMAKPKLKAAPPAAAPRMLRVARVKPRVDMGAGRSLVVSVGCARIEVRSDFDHELLRQVVETLGGGR